MKETNARNALTEKETGNALLETPSIGFFTFRDKLIAALSIFGISVTNIDIREGASVGSASIVISGKLTK